VDGRSKSSHDSKKFRTRSMEKQRGMAFGFRKTATAVIEPDRKIYIPSIFSKMSTFVIHDMCQTIYVPNLISVSVGLSKPYPNVAECLKLATVQSILSDGLTPSGPVPQELLFQHSVTAGCPCSLVPKLELHTYHSHKTLFRSKLITRNVKLQLYDTLI
jgi:hypothetical protein